MFFEGSTIWQSDLFAGMNNNLGILGIVTTMKLYFVKINFILVNRLF